MGKSRTRTRAKSCRLVHPHVRGEVSQFDIGPIFKHGSPPRAWGSPARTADSRTPARFTPTCVGKSSGLLISGRDTSVHPHVRGEVESCSTITASYRRFTPTCVGKSGTTIRPDSIATVHPHVRGEVNASFGHFSESYGSPPRAWGSHCASSVAVAIVRFTPTCVGKSATCCRLSSVQAVHPHVRGEVARRGCRSSRAPVHPHVRGEVAHAVGEVCAIGGSPPRAWGSPLYRAALKKLGGSPPRAWGSPSRRSKPCSSHRFTPTCVGKSFYACFWVGKIVGSPPRAWGSLNGVRPLRSRTRFTPTCVGKSSP